MDNIDIYERVFADDLINPNGCSIKGTFFVSHKYTNYSAVQDLHRKGHEMGVFSITRRENPKVRPVLIIQNSAKALGILYWTSKTCLTNSNKVTASTTYLLSYEFVVTMRTGKGFVFTV